MSGICCDPDSRVYFSNRMKLFYTNKPYTTYDILLNVIYLDHWHLLLLQICKYHTFLLICASNLTVHIIKLLAMSIIVLARMLHYVHFRKDSSSFKLSKWLIKSIKWMKRLFRNLMKAKWVVCIFISSWNQILFSHWSVVNRYCS